MVKRKKILIAQGGGQTVVINQSLIGVIEEAYKINAVGLKRKGFDSESILNLEKT